MRTQRELLRRRDEIDDELADDLPDPIARQLQAQRDILQWIIDGSTLPDEHQIVGRLKMDGDVFERVVLAGDDGSGRLYAAAETDDTGEYLLARRPDPDAFGPA